MKRKMFLAGMALALSVGMSFNCMAFDSVSLGAQGDQVIEIQNALISLGYLTGSADGSYGNGTEAAVIKFQQDNELDPTGVVGEATYNKLMSAAGISVEDTGEEADQEDPYKTALNEAKSLEEICTLIKGTEENLADSIKTKNEEILGLITSYSTYKDNSQVVVDYFSSRDADEQAFYNLVKDGAVAYYKMLIDTVGLSDYDTWSDDMDEFYDVWGDSIEDFYNAWGDGYEELYNKLDDIISDGFDTEDYSEVSDVLSAIYQMYSDYWSNAYKLYSDNWSYMYTLHSEVWSEMYNGNVDLDAAIAEAESKLESEDSENKDEADTASNDTTASTETTSSDSSGEVSADFKAAMDSYEAFIDEYVAFMQNYDATDLSALTEYTSFLTQYADTMQKLESIDENELTPADDAYYLEVSLRIEQKLLSVAATMG